MNYPYEGQKIRMDIRYGSYIANKYTPAKNVKADLPFCSSVALFINGL